MIECISHSGQLTQDWQYFCVWLILAKSETNTGHGSQQDSGEETEGKRPVTRGLVQNALILVFVCCSLIVLHLFEVSELHILCHSLCASVLMCLPRSYEFGRR